MKGINTFHLLTTYLMSFFIGAFKAIVMVTNALWFLYIGWLVLAGFFSSVVATDFYKNLGGFSCGLIFVYASLYYLIEKLEQRSRK